MILLSYGSSYNLLTSIRKHHWTNDDIDPSMNDIIEILNKFYRATWEYDPPSMQYILTFQDPSYETIFHLKYGEYI